jgi:phosphate acetyltransferase
MTLRIQNRTFAELRVGDSASVVRTLTYKDIEVFAIISGDLNPAQSDQAFSKSDAFHRMAGHGMWGATLISAVLGSKLPGPGTIYLGQSLEFCAPISVGDTITVTLTVTEKAEENHQVVFDCKARNQRGELVIGGTARAIAPTETICLEPASLPEIELVEKGAHHRQIIAMTKGREPIRTAVVHPVETVSLLGAIEAAKANLITPVLVGPEAKIRAAARLTQLDISTFELVNAENTSEASSVAVAMAREAKVDALMKGDLHTDELMHAVVDPQHGLRCERRMSHVAVIDVATYPRPLFITDAAINIFPTLDDKRDIVQNAIDLAHALGVALPKVAILSAEETVRSKIPSTLDAGALCKMADRGQITGGILDGPLAFDNAVSTEAAKTKGIVSPVAGQAEIFLVPDLEAGNMLAKQLEYLAGGEMAGIVLGARVPIILTSRADKTLSRLSSCALALLWVRYQQAAKATAA